MPLNRDEIIFRIKTCQNEIRMLDFDNQEIEYDRVYALANEFLQYARLVASWKE